MCREEQAKVTFGASGKLTRLDAGLGFSLVTGKLSSRFIDFSQVYERQQD